VLYRNVSHDLSHCIRAHTVQPFPYLDPLCTCYAMNTVWVAHWPCMGSNCVLPRWHAVAWQPGDCGLNHLTICNLHHTSSKRKQFCQGWWVCAHMQDSLLQLYLWLTRLRPPRRFFLENVGQGFSLTISLPVLQIRISPFALCILLRENPIKKC
jgi:hypothetical protein